MTQRDGAAIYIYFFGIEAQVADYRNRLGSECFIGFHQIKLINGEAGPLKRLP
jgi:hypothetical protein